MPKAQTLQAPAALRGGVPVPDTWDPEAREFDLVMSTGALVRRWRWQGWNIEQFEEVLAMGEDNIRMARLENGRCPFLDAHRSGRNEDVLGTFVSGEARLENEELVSRVRLGVRENAEIAAQEIPRGIGNFSVGYIVHEYEDITEEGAEIPRYLAVDWEPVEGSLVPIGADPDACVRSSSDGSPPELFPLTLSSRDAASEMPRKNAQTPAGTPEARSPETPVTPEVPETPETPEVRAPQAPAVDDNAIAEARAEGQRLAIFAQQAGRTMGLASSTIERVLEATPGEERKIMQALVNARAAQDTVDPASPAPAVRTLDEPLDKAVRGIENAFEHRAAPGHIELSPEGRDFRGLSMVEMARELLVARGINVRGMDRSELARRSLHGTSDFAELASNVMGRTLRRAYDGIDRSFLPISRRVDSPDFRPQRRVSVGAFPALEKVNQHGEVQSGTFSDYAETKQLEEYAKGFGITRRMFIDDDLDALARIPVMVGNSAARLEVSVVWALLTGNVTMADGNQLFSAAHNNTGGGASLDVSGLNTLRKSMRLQKDPSGQDALNIVPKWLIVPAALETDAQKLTASIVPGTVANANPFASQFEGIIVEPMLDATSPSVWYGAGSPNQIDIVEYGYLEGSEGVSLETFEKAEQLGLWWRAQHDFGASVIDYRGLFRNTA